MLKAATHIVSLHRVSNCLPQSKNIEFLSILLYDFLFFNRENFEQSWTKPTSITNTFSIQRIATKSCHPHCQPWHGLITVFLNQGAAPFLLLRQLLIRISLSSICLHDFSFEFDTPSNYWQSVLNSSRHSVLSHFLVLIVPSRRRCSIQNELVCVDLSNESTRL